MMYGELGAYPLFIDIQSRMVPVWCKLNDSGKNDIATTLYKLIYHLNEQNQLNLQWLNHIKTIINTNGFGNVWTSHNEVTANGSFKPLNKN